MKRNNETSALQVRHTRQSNQNTQTQKPHIFTCILDATLEQHPDSLNAFPAKPGERELQLQVSWTPLKKMSENHMEVIIKTKAVIHKRDGVHPVCVAEITCMSKVENISGISGEIDLQDHSEIAQSIWGAVRPHMIALLGLAGHAPEIPLDLSSQIEG